MASRRSLSLLLIERRIAMTDCNDCLYQFALGDGWCDSCTIGGDGNKREPKVKGESSYTMNKARKAKELIQASAWINDEVRDYILDLIESDKEHMQVVKEGDVVKINNKILVVAEIANLNTISVYNGEYTIEPLAVMYNPLMKELELVWESTYTDPGECTIIYHVDPKIIFREDVEWAGC